MVSVTLITQDFYPLKGGIASYLMQMYQKYFSDQKFQVIVPNSSETSSQKLPFRVIKTDFFPFDYDTEARREANDNIVHLLTQNRTDVVLIGYLRSHPEVGLMYKRINPRSRLAITTHAKEIFFED